MASSCIESQLEAVKFVLDIMNNLPVYKSSNFLFVIVGCLFFILWFRAFYGLWWYFEVERQAVTPLQYNDRFGDVPDWYQGGFWNLEDNECSVTEKYKAIN